VTKPFDRARSIYEGIEVHVYGPLGSETPACAEAWSTAGLIAELQNRVEALEAAAKPVESNAPASSDSLVERVADAIHRNGTGDGWREEARAAILAVADWSEQQGLRTAADWLRQEVG
jgi:hypothetical protein